MDIPLLHLWARVITDDLAPRAGRRPSFNCVLQCVPAAAGRNNWHEARKSPAEWRHVRWDARAAERLSNRLSRDLRFTVTPETLWDALRPRPALAVFHAAFQMRKHRIRTEGIDLPAIVAALDPDSHRWAVASDAARDGNGKPDRFFVLDMDLAADVGRQQLGLAPRARNAIFEAVVDHCADGLQILDPQRTFLSEGDLYRRHVWAYRDRLLHSTPVEQVRREIGRDCRALDAHIREWEELWEGKTHWAAELSGDFYVSGSDRGGQENNGEVSFKAGFWFEKLAPRVLAVPPRGVVKAWSFYPSDVMGPDRKPREYEAELDLTDSSEPMEASQHA